jgi:hypothetical protein
MLTTQPHNAEVKKKWGYISSSPGVFTAFAWDSFTLLHFGGNVEGAEAVFNKELRETTTVLSGESTFVESSATDIGYNISSISQSPIFFRFFHSHSLLYQSVMTSEGANFQKCTDI